MDNFEYEKKTKLIFGKNNYEKIGKEIKKYTSKKILITTGGGSVKRTGIYDKVLVSLKDNNIEYVELSGIKPNPELDTCQQGIEIIKEEGIEFILAVGGGSVVDNTKHMAIGSKCDGPFWDLVQNPLILEEIHDLPKIGCVITVAATGSEMNEGGVITNPALNLKVGISHKEAAPVFTVEDPTVLYTLPDYHKRAGVSDTLSHLLEAYFDKHEDSKLQDRIVEALMINVIDNYKQYLEKDNYEACSNIFLTSTYSLNGLTKAGRSDGDWLSHKVEHEISAYTDLTHGIGLAIVHPAVIRYYYEQDVMLRNSLIKYVNLGKNVFNFLGTDQEVAKAAVKALEDLFLSVTNVKKLSEVGIDNFDVKTSIDKLIIGDTIGNYNSLTKQDLENLFNRIK